MTQVSDGSTKRDQSVAAQQRKLAETVKERLNAIEKLNELVLSKKIHGGDARFVSSLFKQSREKSGSVMAFLSASQARWLWTLAVEHLNLKPGDLTRKEAKESEKVLFLDKKLCGERPFAVRAILNGDRFGVNQSLTHEGAPMLEFFDSTHKDATRFAPLGQFVSRYYLSTLKEVEAGRGVNLYGGESAWTISAAALEKSIQFGESFLDRPTESPNMG